MESIVTDMLQWPHRIVVPIGGIPVDTRLVRIFCLLSVHSGIYMNRHGYCFIYLGSWERKSNSLKAY